MKNIGLFLITLAVGGSCFCAGLFARRTAGKIVYAEKEFEVTAYCACSRCCGKWADGQTASGHIIQAGDRFVAADRSLAFGTVVEIPNYGKVPVLDRGGAIKGNKLDVFFESHADALQWGRQRLICKVWK